jgi:hypothetical protein
MASFRTLMHIADIRGRHLPATHKDVVEITMEVERMRASIKSPERRRSFSSLEALLLERTDRNRCGDCHSRLPSAQDVPEDGRDPAAFEMLPGRAPAAEACGRRLCAICATVAKAARLDRLEVTRAHSKANVVKWRRAVTLARIV